MIKLLLVGPPGSGKGTQAATLSVEYGIPAIATGDIFRHHITNQTELGTKVKAIVDAGDYVPDSLVNELVTSRLSESDAAEGFILDGYPRTPDQVSFFDGLLRDRGHGLDAVVLLAADTDELVDRLRKRAIAQGRVDDSEEAIRHRQDVFLRETAPIVAVYRDRGLVVEVDGLGAVDEVAARIADGLGARGIVPTAELSERADASSAS